MTDDELMDLIRSIDPRAVRIPPGVRMMADAIIAAEQEACAALVEQLSARSRTVRAALNATKPEPCQYAAAIRARKG